MPDFDIDFCQDGRDRVIEYVKKKYGAESVSQIATFGTMAARAVVRDVGRVLDLPYSFCDGIAKLIPFQPGRTVTLKRRPAARAAAERRLCARGRAAAGRARGRRGGGARAARARRAARRPAAQRRHARRRRADRAGQAHRFLPAVHAGRRRRAGVAVRQGRRRARRTRQVRLPGPHDADDPRLDAALHADARSGVDAGARDAAARRPGRATTSSRAATPSPCSSSNRAACASCCSRRRRRASTTSSRWSRCSGRGRWSSSPTTFAASRARARRFLRPAARADPRAHLRRDGVPGTGDADRAGRSAATRWAPPTCCAARWARNCPRRWPSTATSSSTARRGTGCRRRRRRSSST